MQALFLSGNLVADCESFSGKDEREYIRFTVAANDRADKDAPATYYSCRMRKTGAAERLKRGRYVALSGSLKVSVNSSGEKTFVNLDVWVESIDVPFTAKEE